MIDLEEALAPLVERAPAPPAVESVARRGRKHRRRRAATLGGTLVLVSVLAIGAIATIANRGSTPRVAGPTADVDHVRVTLLDGSQLDISGPKSLGLSELPMSFNAEIAVPTGDEPLPLPVVAHSFSVSRSRPTHDGPALGHYPTGDAHELVVYPTPSGVDAVVRYDGWTLIVNWSNEPTDWATFAIGLDAHLSPDGYLVFTSNRPDWRLGPTDAPDVRLGDYAFFGPAHERCRAAVLTAGEQCNGEGTVMSRALDPALADTLDEIVVDYIPVGQNLAVTTLEGKQIEITAPPQVLDTYIVQTTLEVDGLQTREPLSVQAWRGPDPNGYGETGPKSFPTADGNDLSVVSSFPDVLKASYGEWTVSVFVPDVSDPDRTRIASLFTARQTEDGLVLEPRRPMRFAAVGWPDVSLDGVSVTSHDFVLAGQLSPSPGAPGEFVVIDNVNRPELVGKVHVREVG